MVVSGFVQLFQDEAGYYKCLQWEHDKVDLLEHNAFAALPYIVDGEAVIATAPACSDYLAHKLGLAGTSETEQGRNRQALAVVYELRNDAMRVLYGPKEIYEHAHRGYLERTARTQYGRLNRWLQMHGTLYLTANVPAQSDFELWEMLDMHELWANDTGCTRPLMGFDALIALYEALRDLGPMQKYYASEAFLLPYNNKMAHFRASDSTWRDRRTAEER